MLMAQCGWRSGTRINDINSQANSSSLMAMRISWLLSGGVRGGMAWLAGAIQRHVI